MSGALAGCKARVRTEPIDNSPFPKWSEGIFHCRVQAENKKHVFSLSRAGSVGKTVTEHLTKLRSGLNFPGFTFIRKSSQISFFFSSPATDCTESELGGCHLLSHRLGKQASPPQHGWGGCWGVFTTLCLRDLGLMCCFLFLRQSEIELGFEQNTECRSLSAPQCNLEKRAAQIVLYQNILTSPNSVW